MAQILLILQLVSELYSVYQIAQQDGTAADVQKAIADLMAEFGKPEVQALVAKGESLFKGGN